MSRRSWLIHPPTVGGRRPGNLIGSGGQLAGLIAIGYLLFLPFLALWRCLMLLVLRPPRVGDVLSIEVAGIPTRYAIVVLEAKTDTEFTIRTLIESTTRKRSLQLGAVNSRTPTREIAQSALKASSPRFIWRDELGFWNPEPGHAKPRGIS